MTVPPWSVLYPPSLLHLEPQYHVFEDLVEGMPDMQIAIGVRRAIMKDEGVLLRAVECLPFVEIKAALA